MKTSCWMATVLLILATTLLAGCGPRLQGLISDDIYYSPKEAYSLPLYINPFRGQVELEERCDATGGSTTFWDEPGRFFRIDYLKIDEHPMAQAPRFASDQTLLNTVMNNYLREVLPTGQAIEDLDTSVREYIKDRDPSALFVILNMNIDTARLPQHKGPLIRGTWYYGFLVFKRKELIYVVQHYQPALMKDKMLQVLSHLADNMVIPGESRADTLMERAQARWQKMTAAMHWGTQPTETEDASVTTNTIRPCN